MVYDKRRFQEGLIIKFIQNFRYLFLRLALTRLLINYVDINYTLDKMGFYDRCCSKPEEIIGHSNVTSNPCQKLNRFTYRSIKAKKDLVI